MFFGISHIVVPVTNLQAAIDLWQNTMGFTLAHQGDGFADIDTGGATLRLAQVLVVESSLSLRLQVADVAKTHAALLAAGATSRYGAMRTPQLEELACVADADGHSITLWRPLTEDEWGFVPALPKQSGQWQPEAEALLQRLLAHVPALFRMLARRKSTRVIEQLAAEANSPVTPELVVRGYITGSAKVTRFRLIEPLRAEGINPDDYKADFDYE